tara:strand:- start:275 stop:577 length:303 start_codon:yes stop_codon:yes gene_type:complete
MTDKKHDSVLVGWADDPSYNDNKELMSWRLRLKDHELKEMLDKYLTIKNERGGGNVYLTMFMSKSGKACCRVYDPNSEGAKEAREKSQAARESVASDLPF